MTAGCRLWAPCLWILLSIQQVLSNRNPPLVETLPHSRGLKEKGKVPPDYVDDVYHCRDPTKEYEGSISCSPDSWRWNLNELNPDQPPAFCSYHFPDQFNPDKVASLPDDLEPCMLWWMFYHDGEETPEDSEFAQLVAVAV